MTDRFHQIVCICATVYQGVTENDALVRFQKHLEEKRLEDDPLHGIYSEGPVPGKEVEEMKFNELRTEFERLMDERAKAMDEDDKDWSAVKNAELYKFGMALMAQALHHNQHDRDVSFRHCRQWTCAYTCMALPEVGEVQWRSPS